MLTFAAAAVTEGHATIKRLPDHASILSAEAQAILLALSKVDKSLGKKFLILSDSMSCLQSIQNKHLENPLVLQITHRLHDLLTSGFNIAFMWVPSHIGLAGNTAADAAAKAALNLVKSDIPIPHSDLSPLIDSHLLTCWQNSWISQSQNKLRTISSLRWKAWLNAL